MKNKLTTLYRNESLTVDGLLKAVAQGWIAIEDAIEIIGEENSTEIIRAAKRKELSVACNKIIEAGVNVQTNNGLDHFNLSIEDQSNISNLFRVVELGGTEYPYQADDGVCTIYSAQEIVNIYLTAQTLITTQLTYHNALKKYLNSLEETTEISQVEYGMELPEPYAEELLGKLAVAQAQVEGIIAKLGG